MKFLNRSTSQKGHQRERSRPLEDITARYANKSEDLLTSRSMKRASMIFSRPKDTSEEEPMPETPASVLTPAVHRGHELSTVNETIDVQEDGLTFSFPTPSQRPSPPRSIELQPEPVPAPRAEPMGKPTQLSKWGRSLKPDLFSLRHTSSTPSLVSLAQSTSGQQELTAIPQLHKKKSNWRTLNSLFRRPSKHAQEPFYKLQSGQQSTTLAQSTSQAEVPRYVPGSNVEAMTPRQAQLDYYNSKPLPSPAGQQPKSKASALLPLSRLRNTSLASSDSKTGSSSVKSPNVKNDSPLEYREVKWPSASKTPTGAGKIKSPGQMSDDAPALDLEIPNSSMERYSVMFGTLLDNKKMDSQARQHSIQERRLSRHLVDVMGPSQQKQEQDIQPPVEKKQRPMSKLFLLPQTYRREEDKREQEQGQQREMKSGLGTALKRRVSSPILQSKFIWPVSKTPANTTAALSPPAPTPISYINRAPKRAMTEAAPSPSPVKMQHVAACLREPVSPVSPITIERPYTAPPPESISPTSEAFNSCADLLMTSDVPMQSPTFLASDSGSEYSIDDKENDPFQGPTGPCPVRRPGHIRRSTCYYDAAGYLVEDTALVTDFIPRNAKPLPPLAMNNSSPHQGSEKVHALEKYSFPTPGRGLGHGRKGSVQARVLRQMSLNRASKQVTLRGSPQPSRNHRYSHYRQDSQVDQDSLQRWIDQQSVVVRRKPVGKMDEDGDERMS